MTVQIKRIYEPVASTDGTRVLVDRLWPRGISRFDAKINLWQKEVAPSTELRSWFGHRPERWKEFQKRYRAELKDNPALEELRVLSRMKRMTLLYAARDTEHTHALVVQSLLSQPPRKRRNTHATTSGNRDG